MKILFVCLGNICRSPLAESVFKSVCRVDYHVDSAGTAGYHIGDSPDKRTIKVLKKYGLSTSHKAQQLKKAHFEEYDWILCMDDSNYDDIMKIKPHDSKAQVMLFGHFNTTEKIIEDPYYGGIEGFETNYKQCLENSHLFIQHLEIEILKQ